MRFLVVLFSLVLVISGCNDQISRDQEIIHKDFIKQGKKCRIRYDKEGVVIDSICYKNGMIDGSILVYDSLWKGYHKCHFINDTLHGKDTMYDQSLKSVIYTGSYFHGERDNEMIIYYENGISEFRFYDFGDPIFKRKYDKKGSFEEEGKPGYIRYLGDSVITNSKIELGLKYACPPNTKCILGVLEIFKEDTVYGGLELEQDDNMKRFVHVPKNKGDVKLEFTLFLFNESYENGRKNISLGREHLLGVPQTFTVK